MSRASSFPPAGASTSWQGNVKPKHSRDAPNGWYRYETQFAVPVLNAKSHRPLHSLWRYASDPKRRRWQIVPVRPAGCAKKKVISAASFSAARRSEVFAPKPSENSVPTSGGNVNTNHAAARKAAQLATIERNNPFDPELGAHAWIRSAEDILTVQGGHRQLQRRG